MGQNITLGTSDTFVTLKNPAPVEEWEQNLLWKKTPGGKERVVLFGPAVRKWAYRLYLPPSDESDFDDFVDDPIDLTKTFGLVDHNGTSVTSVRFLTPPKKTTLAGGHKVVDIALIEVL